MCADPLWASAIPTAYPDASFIFPRRAGVGEYAEALGRDLDYLRAVKEAGYLERFDFQATDSSDAENAEIMAMMMINMTYAAFSTRPNFNFLDVSIEDEGAGTAICRFLSRLHCELFRDQGSGGGRGRRRGRERSGRGSRYQR